MIRLELSDDETGILCDALRRELAYAERSSTSDYVADLCVEILSRVKEQCEAESTQA